MQDKLKYYDFVVMIDKSGSMGTADCPGGMTRWAYAKEYCEAIARECEKFDDNGIDVVMFSGAPKYYAGVNSAKVTELFVENSPNGGTDTAAAVKLVLDKYKERKSQVGGTKPMIVICITDGVPNDKNALAHVIADHTSIMDSDEETGISFVQIGRDAGAREFLKNLDDDLKRLGCKFDIVDTRNDQEMDNISITDILVLAVED